MTEARYRLSKNATQLIGNASPTLAKKIKLDQATETYRFNPEGISPDMTKETDPAKVATLLASQKQQTGGSGENTKNLYSLDLPIDPKQGTVVYDSDSKTSFKLIPEFGLDEGRSEGGRLVYPIDGGGQAVYSVKGNGVKEDIVLTKPRGDELSFTYRLDLPKTLTARLDAQGNLGIYSIDPAVRSAIAGALQSGASSTDTARLKDVEENGDKTHLAYLIPAPTILQSGLHAKSHAAKAAYHLDGTELTVSSSGLERLAYPISIDPSVVVTSTSDFATGNDEGNISFDTDAISDAVATNGTTGAWTAGTSLTGARNALGSVAYNGYLYAIGGNNGADIATVEYAPINANGTLGSWTATSNMTVGRSGFSWATYNGYLYVMGGLTPAGRVATVEYAPINADGSLGSWVTTTSLSGLRSGQASVAYNGYIYVAGGYDIVGSSGWLNTVQYASINADGSLGSWVTTTSLSGVRTDLDLAVYNNFMYVVGGSTTGFTSLSTVEYAPINADGTLGSWTATSSLVTARDGLSAIFYKGYLYAIGGYNNVSAAQLATVEYASVNADGTLGSWAATTSFTTARSGAPVAVYSGRMYLLGGYTGSAILGDVQYAQIDARKDINMSAWTTTAALGAGKGSASTQILTRSGHGSAVYNGYMYLVGGVNAGTTVSSVHYAPLNANGTVGAWVANATSLPAARAGLTSVAVNGYLYAFGGQDTTGAYTATSYYAPLNADGSVGTWATTTALPVAISEVGVTSYNGYMYITGGTTGTGVFVNSVRYAAINSGGTLAATWTSGTNLTANRGIHASMANNGFLYIIGGYDGTTPNATVQFAPINSGGSIGTWTSTTSMPTARYYIEARIYNGYVFIAGGRSSSGVDNNSTIYAKINADGTLGSWVTGTSFTNARNNQGMEIYNGYIYITGGWNGSTYYGDVQYAPLAAIMGGTQAWQTTTAMNLGIYGHATVMYNNFIYVIGGYGGGVYRSDVRYAPVNANGTIGTWTTSPNTMSIVRFNLGAAVYNGYIYVTGGQQAAGVFSNTVEFAKINADGTIGTWTTSGNAFTTARHGHVTVAYNGKLYVVGGGDSANVALADVKYATINADGSIGTWSDTTATTAARDTEGFIYGGRLYILGGVNGTTYSNTLRYATINADGTLGAWTTSPNLFATARSRLAATAVNGYMYLSGGGASVYFGDLQYAQINADGSISSWRASNSRGTVSGAPTTFAYHTMTPYRGKLIELGGIDSANTPQTASYVTSVSAFSLTGVYTKRIDLGQVSTLNSITMNGVLPIGQSNITFKVAGADGVFGAWQLPSSLVGTPLTNVRYVMYKINLDDSFSSDVASSSGRSTVNDVTVDYAISATMTPANRLRHNKYFDGSGMLQPLQTP